MITKKTVAGMWLALLLTCTVGHSSDTEIARATRDAAKTHSIAIVVAGIAIGAGLFFGLRGRK